MKKSELKELIKPIVKECVEESVREIVLESGLLSSVINEVVRGTLPLLVEAASKQEARIETPKQKQPPKNNELMEQLKRERQQIASEYAQQNAAVASSLSMKVGNIDVFKGTKPAPAETANEGVANPLGGVDPRDPGVDISRLLGGKKFINVK